MCALRTFPGGSRAELQGQVLLLGPLLYLQRDPQPLACTLSLAGSLGQDGDLKKGVFSLQLRSKLTRAPTGWNMEDLEEGKERKEGRMRRCD